jgi:hypothetical protein
MRKIAGLLLLFVLLGSIIAAAGDNPNLAKVPKYIWVQTEQYQAGKQAAYMKLGQAFKEAMAKTEFTWLAEMPVAGNGNEVTYVMFPDNFAFIDKAMAAFIKAGEEMAQRNAALVTEGMAAVDHSRSYIAELQPELSTVTDKFSPAQMTRVWVTTFQLKPGARVEFADYLKETRAMREKAGDQSPRLVYFVVSGEPVPAFVVVSPLKSLAELDEPPLPAYEALNTPLFKQHVLSTVKNTIAAINRTIFMIDPRLSLPPENFLAENPGFWVVKEPVPVVAQTGKKAKKAAEPAAQKEKEKK